MRYWWVNNNQTFRQEVNGGYLWSPVTEASGARSQFYENMREASPGDLVLSYAGGAVRRIGLIADFAIASPKPAEFGATGAYWKDAGWLLPVQWLNTELAVSPKTIISSLAPFLPTSHSPVRPETGTGNQKAYLAEVTRDAVRVVLSAAGLDLANFEGISASVTIDDFRTRAEDALEQEIRGDLTLDETIREQLTRARRGQGLFRRRVLSLECICRITGITNPALLRASHVKPWRSCQTADERLDGHNGLMLAPHADFLFDKGLLTFADDGRALFSPKLSESDGIRMGLFHSQRPPPRPFQAPSLSYLDHHRRVIFIT